MMNTSEQAVYGATESEPESDLGIPVSFDSNALGSEQKDQTPQYTIQGVLHFLQTEWARLETQRSDWETDRAELKARIAFLEGERRGQENLKQDLVRRIKMLEYALKQERVKFHQYKATVSSNTGSQSGTRRTSTEEHSQPWRDEPHKSVPKQMDSGEKLALYTKQALESSSKWLESRSRLKKFLEEVGCTDTLLSVRQARVLQLLKSTPEWRSALTDAENKLPGRNVATGRDKVADDQLQSALSEMDQAIGGDHVASTTYGDESTEPDTTGQSYEMSEGVHVSRFRRTGGGSSSSVGEKQHSVTSGLASDGGPHTASMATAVSSFISDLKSREEFVEPKQSGRGAGGGGVGTFVDKRILGLIDALSDNSGEASHGINEQVNGSTGASSSQGLVSTRFGEQDGGERSNRTDLSRDHVPGDGLVLGDLASLTVANEIEQGADNFESNSQLRTTYDSGHSLSGVNTSVADYPAKSGSDRPPLALAYNLRGHFDVIRSVAFHPTSRSIFTAGDDGCVMLWDLGKSSSNSASSGGQPKQSGRVAASHSTDDLEPVYVYRGHDGPVLCVTTPSRCVPSNQSSVAFSGGLDGTVRGWRLPPVDDDSGNIDLYAPYEPSSTVGPVFRGSKAAVWSISTHPSSAVLIAAHADGAVEFWPSDDFSADSEDFAPLRTVHLDQLLQSAVGRPTCVQYLSDGPDSSAASQCVIGTSKGWLIQLDVQTGQVVGRTAPDEWASQLSTDWSEMAFNGLAIQLTLSIVVGAHEDKRIRFYDISRMPTDHSVVSTIPVMEEKDAHMDSVTCVAINPQGLDMLTGSHDASIRLWDLDFRSCIQEMTNHRQKNNEAVLSVAYHPRHPLAASAAADGICKVYAIAY